MVDGIVRLLPCNLLVEGDIVLLAYDDRAPASVIFMNAPTNDERWKLKREQLLHPSFFSDTNVQDKGKNGLYYFQVLETPLKTIINSLLHSKRPETMIGVQFRLLDKLLIKYILWIVLLASFLVNTLRLALLTPSEIKWKRAFETMVHYQSPLFY